jgi:hypothetical protein
MVRVQDLLVYCGPIFAQGGRAYGDSLNRVSYPDRVHSFSNFKNSANFQVR